MPKNKYTVLLTNGESISANGDAIKYLDDGKIEIMDGTQGRLTLHPDRWMAVHVEPVEIAEAFRFEPSADDIESMARLLRVVWQEAGTVPYSIESRWNAVARAAFAWRQKP